MVLLLCAGAKGSCKHTDTMREQMKKVTIKEEVPRGKEVDKNAARGLGDNE
jgi:hypothetical protein